MTDTWDWSCVPDLDPETLAIARDQALAYRSGPAPTPKREIPYGQMRSTVMALLDSGLAHAEVAARLGMSRQCVRTHENQARQAAA